MLSGTVHLKTMLDTTAPADDKGKFEVGKTLLSERPTYSVRHKVRLEPNVATYMYVANLMVAVTYNYLTLVTYHTAVALGMDYTFRTFHHIPGSFESVDGALKGTRESKLPST